MSKKVPVITTLIVIFIALSATAVYISLRQGSKEVEEKQPVATESVESEKPVGQAKEPTITEPIDTSDWKTYRSEEYEFEVRYPPSYEIQDLIRNGKRIGKIIVNPQADIPTLEPYVSILAVEKDLASNPIADRLEDYKKNYYNN